MVEVQSKQTKRCHLLDRNRHAWWPMIGSFLLALLARFLPLRVVPGQCAMVSVERLCIAVIEKFWWKIVCHSIYLKSKCSKRMQGAILKVIRWSVNEETLNRCYIQMIAKFDFSHMSKHVVRQFTAKFNLQLLICLLPKPHLAIAIGSWKMVDSDDSMTLKL